ncbi:MAG: DUF1553 domain-containing protein [Gemmataceae bacterium]
MMKRIILGIALLCLGLPGVSSRAAAADLRVYPPSISLQAPNGSQRLIAVMESNGQTVGEAAKASFSCANPQVAAVSADGVVTATGAGQTTITVRSEGKSASMSVVVSGPLTGQDWSFTRHVIPTLTRAGCNSGACHGALAGKGGLKLSLRGFDPPADWFAMTRQAHARRVDQAAPTESLLLKKAVRSVPHGGGTRFTDDSPFYAILRDWIARGAPGPKPEETLPQSIEVYPPGILGTLKGSQKLIVVARYSDGHSEDVTKWAKFTSSEEQVATVDEDGAVAMPGSGVAGINAVFGTSVATVMVTVPFPQKVESKRFAIPSNASFIDELILLKLKELNLPPSPAASDAVFIRRAFLDTCGILPTPRERDEYVADRSPDKKLKLIEKLLSRKEYVDYWTYRWSDLFLVSTRDLPQSGAWSYYRSIRQAVADNMPWDRFARSLLTVSGSTLQTGTSNYYVLHKDTAKLAETTSLTFLGTSIGCAKCHNHPLEKWTQDDYWAFANLFARVSYKNGEAPEEVIVSSSPVGEALHPRRGVGMPPAPLGGTPLTLDSSVDRREHFANWLTAKDNPYFAKAAVNRVWKAYMGRGLVEADDDLRATNPPTNAALFDALAADFVKNGYDLKRTMKLILLSDAYGRSSTPLAGNAADDRFYSRYFVRRLPAEVILDAYSAVTDVETSFVEASAGPSNGFVRKSDYPTGTRAVQLPDILLVSPFLDQFGRPDRLQVCSCERTADSSVGQALHVSNGQTLNDKLRNEKSVVSTWLAAKESDETIVDRAFLRALGRSPTPVEQKKYVDALRSTTPASRREMIEDILWALLTGREFLFNH